MTDAPLRKCTMCGELGPWPTQPDGAAPCSRRCQILLVRQRGRTEEYNKIKACLLEELDAIEELAAAKRAQLDLLDMENKPLFPEPE